MAKVLEVKDALRLRRVIGGFFLVLFVPCLLVAYFSWARGSFDLMSLLFLFGAVFFLGLGLISAFGLRAPRPRLRVSDQGIWISPDKTDWLPLAPGMAEPATIPLNDLIRVGDGGVLYGHRRLTLVSDHGIFRINTTHLDTTLRSIVAGISDHLERNGKALVEQELPLRVRSGVWQVR